MTLEQVKYLRELNNNDILIFADNAKFFNMKSEKTHVIWDDEREIVHAIRTNTNFYSQSKKPIQIESFSYEMIQYIGTLDSIDELTELLNKLKADSLIDDEQITKILNDFKK